MLVRLGDRPLFKSSTISGIEPDKCYFFDQNREFPDLVIEVVITSGGIDLLEIYRALDVQEVWFWEKGKIKMFFLTDNIYTEVKQSTLLPDLEKKVLESFLTATGSSLKIRKQFKQAIT
ncbi:MAG: hypothetical protein HC799_11225 [Limnothrix sp. RL_2_0]|nr:hypothetical protein [Limnothrix sp. RL_2_0]